MNPCGVFCPKEVSFGQQMAPEGRHRGGLKPPLPPGQKMTNVNQVWVKHKQIRCF